MPIGNGGIIGVANDPTSSVASGVWSLQEQELAKKAGAWPNNDPTLVLDFDETTTLDSRITFTRATNGTYFDSSGVLQTASSGAARFDHRLEGGVWVNKGLLIEQQRTNISIKSEQFDDAHWVKTNSTISADAIGAPDGNTTADSLLPTTTSVQVAINGASIVVPKNGTYAGSCFIKSDGASFIYLSLNAFSGNAATVYFDLSTGASNAVNSGNGSVISGSIKSEDVENGWWRFSFAGIPNTALATNNIAFTIGLADSLTAGSIYTGSVSDGIYLWGAQVEAGAFPTSYIKTTTASVTRNADVVVMTGTNFSDWYNQTEGTVFWQGDFTGVTTASARAFAFSNNTSNERIICIARSDFFRATGIDGGVTQFEIDASGVVTGQTYEAALALKLNDIAFAVDGSLIGTDTSATLPTPDRVYLGSNFNGGETLFNGHAAKFYYWNTRKTNFFLQNITS